MLRINNISVFVDNKIIIKNFSYHFQKNKIYAIMGPNGSGKSSLAYALMGHPDYKVVGGKLKFEGKDITNISSDKRARKGIFLSFQTPLALNGVNVFQLLLVALKGKKDPLVLRDEINQFAGQLGIKRELVERPLNEGCSGGEKKKLEVLQATILDPKLLIFDEVDTGVDVDALKSIALFIKKYKADKTCILITHYNRILHHIRPDKVLVLIDGELKKEGDWRLAKEIEAKGYQQILANHFKQV